MHFDWTTLALQTVNLGVLIWLMQRFLFKPVTAIIRQRKDAAEKLLADAAALRDEARAHTEQAAAREKALAADSDRLLAAARAAAETERASLLAQAQADAARTRDMEQTSLQQDRARIRRELEAEACQLAVAIASRLLDRIPAQASSVVAMQQLETCLSAMPPAALQDLAGPDEALEVATAAELDAATQAACTEMLHRRTDGALTVRFTTDPALLAGVELRGAHGRLRNNWRADLERIREELSRDGQQLAVA